MHSTKDRHVLDRTCGMSMEHSGQRQLKSCNARGGVDFVGMFDGKKGKKPSALHVADTPTVSAHASVQ